MNFVRPISYEETKPFLLNIHYAKRMPMIQYAYGLFDEERLVGVVTYGQPATPSISKGIGGEEYKKRVLELNRLCLLPEYNGKNNASKLIGRSLRLLPKDYFIVSYSDTAMGHIGYVYQATNWLYTGMTKPRTDMRNKNGKHPRHYEKGEQIRVERSAKHRYVYMTGNKEEQIKSLQWKIYPYPKGNSIRYNIEHPKVNVLMEKSLSILETL